MNFETQLIRFFAFFFCLCSGIQALAQEGYVAVAPAAEPQPEPDVKLAISVGSREQPVRYAERHLTLPQRTLRIDYAPIDFAQADVGYLNHTRGLRIQRFEDRSGPPGARTDDTAAWTSLGVSYGVFDEFEAGALLLPVLLAPDTDFGDMQLYGRYRVLEEGDTELAIHFAMQLPTQTDFGFEVGAPLQVRISPMLRVDAGAELEFVFFDDTLVNLNLPIAMPISLSEHGFIGPRSALLFVDFDDAVLALGGFGGYTIADGDKTIGDVMTHFYVNIGGDDVGLPDWELMFAATFFLDFPES
ncbi:MAG: hypothetical protein AAF355_07420 [Myxococcota bacterium]